MTNAIQARYGELADSSCCLSCGSAVSHISARPGQICVDLGSGRGADVLRLAEQVSETGHAYGIDITDVMLQKARRSAEKLGVTNASFVQADLAALPLGDAQVDWVTSNCVLNHAADKPAVWREIARILKPGGQFVVSDIYAIEPVPDIYRNDPKAIAECWAGAILKSEYLAAIADAGLTNVEIFDESAPYEKGKVKVASFTIRGSRTRAPSPSALEARERCCC